MRIQTQSSPHAVYTYLLFVYFKVAWKEWENNLGGLYLTDQTPIGEDFAESVRRQSPCADVLSQV